MKNIIKGFVFCILIAALASCTIESKVSRSLIKSRSNFRILVLKPDFVYKVNQKEDSINNISTISPEQKDSIAISKSVFLKYINDSLILDIYYNSIIDELKAYGIKVFTDSTSDKIYKSDSLVYIFNVSQLELDENLLPFEDKMYIDTAWYYQNFELNAVALDTWFEATEVNGTEKKSKVLYSEHTANDIIKGSFQTNLFSNQVNYKYKREDLTIDDIYKFASYSGRKNAEYIFDFILNEILKEKLKSLNQYPASQYYHYNRAFNYITPIYNGRFTVL